MFIEVYPSKEFPHSGHEADICSHSGLVERNSSKAENEMISQVPPGDIYDHSSLELENHRFTYRELDAITNNFERLIAQGGFGYVYHGILENGMQVAVKLRSESSRQGVKEFLAEV